MANCGIKKQGGEANNEQEGWREAIGCKMSGRDQPVIERRGGGARGGIKRRVGYDKLSLWALFVVAFLAIFWHFLDQIYKCESISLPACASAALLQEIVSRSNPLKECSS